MVQGGASQGRSERTPQERRVLERVLQGETNKEIAKALNCSVKTIEFHVSNLLKKAGVDSRLRLAVETLAPGTWAQVASEIRKTSPRDPPSYQASGSCAKR